MRKEKNHFVQNWEKKVYTNNKTKNNEILVRTNNIIWANLEIRYIICLRYLK